MREPFGLLLVELARIDLGSHQGEKSGNLFGRRVITSIDQHERSRNAGLVLLPGVVPEERIQLGHAAIEALAIL